MKEDAAQTITIHLLMQRQHHLAEPTHRHPFSEGWLTIDLAAEECCALWDRALTLIHYS